MFGISKEALEGENRSRYLIIIMTILMIVDNHDGDDDFVHQGHGHIQFSLVPSTVAARLTVDVFLNTDCIPNVIEHDRCIPNNNIIKTTTNRIKQVQSL